MQGQFVFDDAPGHLIRRAHQISVAVFADETDGHGMTPVQFAILNALTENAGIDQITLAGRVAFDAATIGSVIGRLEAKGWLRRASAASDRRRKLLWLTPEGKAAVQDLTPSVEQVQQRILAPLTETERRQLVRLLRKLVTEHPRNTAT